MSDDVARAEPDLGVRWGRMAFVGSSLVLLALQVGLLPGWALGITDTGEKHFSGHFTIGQKFFLTELFLFRLEWRISKFTDKVNTPQGATSLANGGPGFVEQSVTTHNIIFGLGVSF